MAESADIGPPSDCQLWAAAASAQRAFSSDCDDATVTAGWLQPSAVFKEPEGTHRIHGAAIYGNMDPINIPPMLAYIPAPWILWGMEIASRMFNGRPSKTDINWMLYMNISRVTTSALIGSCSPHLQWHSKLVSLRAFLGVPCGLRKAPQSWNRLIIVTPKKIQKRVSRMVYIHDIYICIDRICSSFQLFYLCCGCYLSFPVRFWSKLLGGLRSSLIASSMAPWVESLSIRLGNGLSPCFNGARIRYHKSNDLS